MYTAEKNTGQKLYFRLEIKYDGQGLEPEVLC